MTKTSTKAEFNNFIKGIITEASPLNFPENASLDEQNFELNRDGTRSRRLGIDFNGGGTFFDLDSPTYIQSYLPNRFKWMNIGSAQDQDVLVVQEGNSLHLFDMNAEGDLETNFITTVSLSEFPVNASFSFASVDGRMVIACGDTKFAVVSKIGETYSVEYLTIQVRDLWGVEVGEYAYDNDPSYRGPLTTKHYYNLQNQSWGTPRKSKDNIKVDPITYYLTDLGVAPSNTEVVWTGLQYQAVSGGADPFERIYTKMYDELLGANVKAPKGYFIIDALNRGLSRQLAFEANKAKYSVLSYSTVELPADKTTTGATYVSEFSGRIFFSGFGPTTSGEDDRSPNLSNYIFFTQLIKNKTDYSKCYQEGDPTSRENSDIVDTDGGFVRIAGADKIIATVNIGKALIILANNGIWALQGGSDYGFTATNYRVDKISSFGCISPRSVVTDGSKMFYWAEDGIYMIAFNEQGGISAKNLTELTIDSLYSSIDNSSKTTADGVYDTLTKKIRWVYRTGELFDTSSTTYELILDLSIGSFYKFKIYNDPGNLYQIVCGFDTNQYTNSAASVEVDVGSDTVYVGSDIVYSGVNRRYSSVRNIRYLVLKQTGSGYQYSFADYSNLNFMDWGSVDAEAYLITGGMTAGDSSAIKQVPYLIVSMGGTETHTEMGVIQNKSSCSMQFLWDWAQRQSTKRWTLPQEVYRVKPITLREINDTSVDSGFPVIVTKSKIRGSGRAFSIKFNTNPGKDCKLLGWSVSLNGIPIT